VLSFILVHAIIWQNALVQAAPDASQSFSTSNPLQTTVASPSLQQNTQAKVHPLSKDFDSNAALKTSQAAIGHQLSDYAFYDQNGNVVNMSDFRGKPIVISLIYTSCFHICPATTKNIARAIAATRSAVGKNQFTTISIGFDTLHDTPDRMRSFARQQGVAGDDHWFFLSADKTTINRLAINMGFIFKPSTKGFDHLIQTTIVDKDGKIYRQIYGMDFDPAILTEAMKELVFGLSPATLNLSSLTDRIRLFCTVYDPASGTYKLNYAMIFGMVVGIFMLLVTGIFFYRFLRD